MPPRIRAFVQARMSSRRFPGKVLAPLAGKPVVAHVLERVSEALPREHIVLATSDHRSDDPLAGYADALGFAVHRGDLEDVVARFQGSLRAHPCDWFFRICADSPLYDPGLMRRVASLAADDLDLVTNTFPRSFPKGRSVELVRAAAFAALEPTRLSPAQREHATAAFYDHAAKYRILNVPSGDPALAQESLVVDTLEDLARLETMLARGAVPAAAPPA